MEFYRTQDNAQAKTLWSLPKDQFNAWRREHDLPALLGFFRVALPHFSEWQQSYLISDVEFLAVDRTSQFLRGDGTRYLLDATSPGPGGEPRRALSIHNVSGLAWRSKFGPTIDARVHGSKTFEPYFYWLRTRKRVKLFPVLGDLNNDVADDLKFSSWHGAPGRGFDLAFTRALLFKKHAVLKMGGATITSAHLDGRNLDFVDLDGLTIVGSGGSSWTYVTYSSCRGVSLDQAEKAFITFERCHVEGFSVNGCRLQDIHFVECGRLSDIRLTDSRLNRCGFERSAPGGMVIENCELLDFHFDPAKRMPAQAREDVYKRLRNAYQTKGNRREAGQCYYLERLNELKSHIVPFISDGLVPLTRGVIHDYSEAYERWRIRNYETKTFLRLLLNTLLWYAKALFVPPYTVRLLSRKARVVPHVLDWLVWGFGERPGWVFRWMLLVVLGWTGRYYWGNNPALSGQAWESLSCSTFNFATIGCEHKTSLDSLEGILGATLVGVMVAGFANRTRY